MRCCPVGAGCGPAQTNWGGSQPAHTTEDRSRDKPAGEGGGVSQRGRHHRGRVSRRWGSVGRRQVLSLWMTHSRSAVCGVPGGGGGCRHLTILGVMQRSLSTSSTAPSLPTLGGRLGITTTTHHPKQAWHTHVLHVTRSGPRMRAVYQSIDVCAHAPSGVVGGGEDGDELAVGEELVPALHRLVRPEDHETEEAGPRAQSVSQVEDRRPDGQRELRISPGRGRHGRW